MLETVDEIIEAVGGTTAAAALVGVTSPAVSHWKTRNGIPTEHFFVFSEALERLGHRPSPAVFGFKGGVPA